MYTGKYVYWIKITWKRLYYRAGLGK